MRKYAANLNAPIRDELEKPADLIDVNDAAKLLNVSISQIYKLRRLRIVSWICIGHKFVFDPGLLKAEYAYYEEIRIKNYSESLKWSKPALEKKEC